LIQDIDEDTDGGFRLDGSALEFFAPPAEG
jgi:hypothetical protein